MFDAVLFGNRLKHFIKSKGLTYKEFAELSGVNYFYLKSMIAGKNKQPPVNVIISLLKALNLNYSELMSESDYEKSVDISILENLKQLDEKESKFMALIFSQLKKGKVVEIDGS